jgi:predicted RNA-binding Zn-ribbon protein involved in translation (DUF1610 family)
LASRTNNNRRRSSLGLTLEQELAQSFACPHCGMEVYWNQRAIHRRTGKPMVCDAVNGGPEYNQGHYCAILFEQRKEKEYLQRSWEDFCVSVKPSTLIALYGEDRQKVSISENITFKVINKNKKKKKERVEEAKLP